MNFLKISLARVILFLALFVVPSLVQSPAAYAFGAYPGACGTGCLAAGGGMFRPFYGTPVYPVAGNMYSYQTGQWANNGAQLRAQQMMIQAAYVSNQYNWPGAQPMGYSYLPPMGLSALMNSLSYGTSARY